MNLYNLFHSIDEAQYIIKIYLLELFISRKYVLFQKAYLKFIIYSFPLLLFHIICIPQRHLHQCGLEETPGWRTRLSRSRINSAVYIPNSSAECDPLVPADCAVSLRRAKSAGNLQGQHHDLEFQRQDSEFQRQESEFERQDSDVFKPESDTSGHNHFELPVLSISVATEKPFVEQHLQTIFSA